MEIIHLLKERALRIIYEEKCLHCNEELPIKNKTLCASCFELMEPLKEKGRCPTCFQEWKLLKPCHLCEKEVQFYKRQLIVFDPIGPAHSFFHHYIKRGKTHFAKTIASYILMQLIKSKEKLPDYIIPFPEHPYINFSRGSNANQLIGKALSELIFSKVKHPIKRSLLDQFIVKKIPNGTLLLVGGEAPNRKEIQEVTFLLSKNTNNSINTLFFIASSSQGPDLMHTQRLWN